MAYHPPSSDLLFPLLGIDERKAGWASIDLNACPDDDLITHRGLAHCVDSQISIADASIGYGGYLEKRSIYRRSNHFTSGEELREIHLGCDIWGSAGQAIFSPLEGYIHSFAFNDKPFDYGATIIVKHIWEGQVCFALYGHLQKSDLEGIEAGGPVEKGQKLCHMGDLQDNRGWVPHLHFQLIRDIREYKGDYPGVAAQSQLGYFKENCPDPSPWLL